VISDAPTCTVLRVTRPNTLMVRYFVPEMQATCTFSLCLLGVRCKDNAVQAILDWLEVHADYERVSLVTCDWVRDSYGRVLGDLLDVRSKESLTEYLIQSGAATPRANHLESVLTDMLSAPEPEVP